MKFNEIIPGIIVVTVLALFTSIFTSFDFYNCLTFYTFWGVMDLKHNN